jgi:hypothetical protein
MIILLSCLPANTCALHGDGNLALLECLAVLDLLFARRCLCHPQIVLWVGVDTNVLLGRREGGGGCGGGHVGGRMCFGEEKATMRLLQQRRDV